MSYALFTRTAHILVLVSALVVPFLPLPRFRAALYIYAAAIPTLWLHWLLASNVCALVITENLLLNRPMLADDGPLGRMLEPFFALDRHTSKAINWLVTGVLWALCVMRLVRP